MHDSGGADTSGWEMLITSAVAILFSCSDWDTHRSQSLAVGRANRLLVTLKGLIDTVSRNWGYDTWR
ncbi:MAG TPA: hypothetical protein VFA85_19470 [Terriglobales bacterium]|nr:hypothetical protein [Terriglobales bacterium]